MKKSELKEIIREVVKEELEKLEATKAADEVATEEPAAEATEAEESTEDAEDAEVVESLTESIEEVQEEVCDGEACESDSKEECLEEGADIIPTDKSSAIVREGSIESLAVDIYNSDEFIDAFVEDGQTFGYAVDEVISNAVIAAYPSFAGDRLDDMINKTRKAIRAHADQEDKDFQLSYSDDFTGDFDRIYKDHFDLAGNAY
jgi:rRNA-processing protein FCF1